MRALSKLGSLALAVLGLSSGLAQAATVQLINPTATFSQADFPVSAAIDGLFDTKGWAISPKIENQSATFDAQSPVGGAGGTLFTFTLSQLFPSPDKHTIGMFKLSVTTNGSTWNNLTGVTFTASPTETPVSIAGDGTILLNGILQPSTSVYTVAGTTTLSAITGFKLDVLENGNLPYSGPGRQPTNGNFVLTEFQVDATALTPAPTAVPLPGAAWAGMALLGGLGVAKRLRRHA